MGTEVNPSDSVKVWHIMYGRPMGASYEAYLTPFEVEPDPYYGMWVEETTLESLTERFRKHIEYAILHHPESYFPYELKIGVTYGKVK